MELALSVKNKLIFVDGLLPRPDGTNPQMLNLWTYCNNLLVAWIYHSVSKDIIATIIHSSVAADIWRDLREQFQQKNGSRIFQLRHDLMSLIQGNDFVSL